MQLQLHLKPGKRKKMLTAAEREGGRERACEYGQRCRLDLKTFYEHETYSNIPTHFCDMWLFAPSPICVFLNTYPNYSPRFNHNDEGERETHQRGGREHVQSADWYKTFLMINPHVTEQFPD